MANSLKFFAVSTQPNEQEEIFIAHHGLEALGIITAINREMSAKEGYYLRFDNDYRIYFCNKYKINIQQFKKLFPEMLTRGIFDETLYNKYQILTSLERQERWAVGVKRVINLKIVEDYLYKSIIPQIAKVCISPENCEENVTNSEQTKQNNTNKSNDSLNNNNILEVSQGPSNPCKFIDPSVIGINPYNVYIDDESKQKAFEMLFEKFFVSNADNTELAGCWKSFSVELKRIVIYVLKSLIDLAKIENDIMITIDKNKIKTSQTDRLDMVFSLTSFELNKIIDVFRQNSAKIINMTLYILGILTRLKLDKFLKQRSEC